MFAVRLFLLERSVTLHPLSIVSLTVYTQSEQGEEQKPCDSS